MDIISQLQEQVNAMALLTLNTFGTLQRDAPSVRLSPNYPEPAASASEETIDIMEHPKTMSAALVEAAKKFDVLVTALPLSGEEAQLKRIAELQAENEAVGLELQKQLEATEKELKQVQERSSIKQQITVCILKNQINQIAVRSLRDEYSLLDAALLCGAIASLPKPPPYT